MHIRTFRAANLNAALEMIRDEMGPDASVLHTRQMTRGVLPWPGRRRVEVTAGLKANRPPAEPARTEPVDPLVEALIAAGLPTRIANQWVRRAAPRTAPAGDAAPGDGAPGGRASHAELRRFLQRSIPVGAPIPIQSGKRRVVALVGPTGVGKTTTIAKLAAGFQLRQKARVGLLTLDTFRAAAVEQLDAFARTLKAPMEVVRRAEDVAGALGRLGNVDLVLIDTMGQSPRGNEKIAAMARWLAAAEPDETHLVLDANNSFRSAVDVLAAFETLRPTAVIVSKMDEVRQPAPVIAAMIEGSLKISYVTTGQMVPGDIAAADAGLLAAAASDLALAGCES